MATKVKLRQKAITGNRHSLYLDFYPPIPNKAGELTRREFLNLYILDKPKNPVDKQYNKEQLQLAEQIRQKRENNLNKPEVYNSFELEQLKIKERGKQNFVTYFKGLADKRKASNHDNWVSAYNYLKAFTNGHLQFSELDEKFCNDFREHLLTTKSNRRKAATLSQNSAVSYFNKFKAALKQAYKDKYLKINLNELVEPVKPADTRREYLTLAELNRLVKIDCRSPLLKRAAIFSAMTGLRFSDIQKLTWGEVRHSKEQGHYIQFQQQKTKGEEVLPISEQAFNYLGKPQGSRQNVFEGLVYSAYENKHLHEWIKAAGIEKNITFHCFRHTFATQQIAQGTDIFTVSKMLGHRELKTTQIYAKVMDKAKREAADKIQLDM
jgi:integrase